MCLDARPNDDSLTCNVAMRREVDRERGLDRRDGNVCVNVTITICWLKLLKRHVGTGPFDRAGQLLEGRHTDYCSMGSKMSSEGCEVLMYERVVNFSA